MVCYASRYPPPAVGAVARLRVSALSLLIFASACEPASAEGGPAGAGPRGDARAATAPAAGPSTDDVVARGRQDSTNRARPGYVIDSVRPVDEEIRRFQATLDTQPRSFSGGASSRSALVRAFIQAVEGGDERALRALMIDRSEFGYLVYPHSPNTRPPYRLSPDVVWLQRTLSSDKAAGRLINRFGGRSLEVDGHSCAEPAERQGVNRVWIGCVVRRRAGTNEPAELRLFGPIIEREGRFKLLSLANGL